MCGLFLGEVALDEYFYLDVWPDLGSKITADSQTVEVGGTIANAAAVYSSLGGKAWFSYVLNSSEVSRTLCSELEDQGIDTSLIQYRNGISDSKTIILLVDGEHTVIIPDRDFDEIYLEAHVLSRFREASFLYSTLADIRMLTADNMNAVDVVTNLQNHGVKLALDLDVGESHEGDEEIIALADVVFVNEVGLGVLRPNGSIAESLRSFVAGGADVAVATLGRAGCKIVSHDTEYNIKGIKVDPVDVTGAGDTFCSAFMRGLEITNNLKMVGEFANAAAAFAVTRIGPRAGVVDPQVILNFATEHGRGEATYLAEQFCSVSNK